MAKSIRKNLVLFILIIISFLGSFSWEILAFKKFQLNWATIFGIFIALCYSVNNRWIKWKDDPEFNGEKLAWPFVISFFIYIPIILGVVLPELGQPRGTWLTDSFIAFFVSCFFMTNISATAIAKDWKRLEKIIKSNGETKNDS